MKHLNLHLHTTYSDGMSSILKYCDVVSKEYCCLVISDHDYMMKREEYLHQLEEAKEVSQILNFPIICGMELTLWRDEAILIGEKACIDWFNVRDSIIKELKEGSCTLFKNWLSKFNKEDYFLCLVHPHGIFCTEVNFPCRKEMYSNYDAYEIGNHGSVKAWIDNPLLPELMPTARPVMGVDAHGAGCIGHKPLGMTELFVEVDRINNEKELIKLLREGDFKLDRDMLRYDY